MNLPGTIPAVVSKRNEFQPADELVEEVLPYLPEQYKQPAFRKWLTDYTERVIRRVASHFAVAASRGIEQAAELLCDPEFYETRRQKRTRQRLLWKEEQAKQEWERIERMNCPTAEQIAEQVRWAERQVAYHQAELEKYEKNLERLRTLVPKNIRIVPSNRLQ
jgi:hypothetical protein